MHAHTHMLTHTCAHTHTCACYTHARTHMHTRTHTTSGEGDAYAHTYACTHCVCLHIHTYMCMLHARMHTHTRTHTHTHTTSGEGNAEQCEECTPDELAALVREIQDSGIIGNHTYHLVQYKNCFVGKDLVTWLMKKKNYKSMLVLPPPSIPPSLRSCYM